MIAIGMISVFIALLCLGAVMDVRVRRVPNELVAVLLAIGLVAGALRVSMAGSIGTAALGTLVGLAIWLPMWLLGLLGAGDVKFFAAASAWLGPSLSWRASIAVAILGGVFGVLLLVARRGVWQSAQFGLFGLTNARAVIQGADAGRDDTAKRTFPYAVPMAIAVALAAFYPTLF